MRPDSAGKSSGKPHMPGIFDSGSTRLHPAHFAVRLGQEPPPQQQDDHYDGRSLAEVSNTHHTTSRLVLTFHCGS